MSQRGFHSIEIAASAAQQAVAGGRYAEAERAYRELIGQTHVVDYEYDDWLRGLADAYRHLRRPREAGFVQLYLHGFDAARAAFGALPELRARLCEVEKRWADAAALWIEAGRPVHAAVAWDKAKVYDKARAAWEAVANQPGLRDRPYEQALVQFNIGTAIGKLEPGAAEARKALIEAQRRLEQVADDFEIAGELERAFDCFQIVLKLGKDSGQFENIAEGYVNCIRVLAGDNLKFYVLQYYEDFIRLALERGELHAAATTYQEAAQYAQQVHLPYDRRYQAKSADTWQRCGEKYAEDGLPVEMVENAFLAAIQQYSAVSDYVGVRRMFERLAKLDLSDDKRARYQTVARRYDGASGGGGDAPAFPDYLKQQHAYADIWFADLLEWELAGDPQAVAAAMVGDLRYPNGIRRRALVVLLTTADAEVRDLAAAPETLTALAEQLGELQSYAALAPLEVLYRHPEPAVRRSAIKALRYLYFKRSFATVRRALSDPDAGVREAALLAITGLHFPHALGPLARIYQEATEPRVRGATIDAMGKIQTVEAGEVLIGVLRQETGVLRDAARSALVALDNPDIVPILRAHYEVESDPTTRDILADVLRRL
ncbi:MAG: HEAT repeat domain-containing protein [Kofleriaceae bacterium]|nr:HEAT repeat domain-containing protein [Kofleriaceae bacterium]MBP9170342.1 HEAT repeat domain-containing protein [Kofleriaceae bacterium]MBP9862552.1 HEAT repeat domain-containing protein [Kofleriaceae bacterium]